MRCTSITNRFVVIQLASGSHISARSSVIITTSKYQCPIPSHMGTTICLTNGTNINNHIAVYYKQISYSKNKASIFTLPYHMRPCKCNIDYWMLYCVTTSPTNDRHPRHVPASWGKVLISFMYQVMIRFAPYKMDE